MAKTESKSQWYDRQCERLETVIDFLRSAKLFHDAENYSQEHDYCSSAWHILQDIKCSLKMAGKYHAEKNNLPNDLKYWHSIQDRCQNL